MFFSVKAFFTESIYADGKPPVDRYNIYREENLILKGISHEEFLNFINDRNRLHDTDLFEYNNLTYNGAEARAKIDVFRTIDSVLDEAINTVMSNHPWGHMIGGVVPNLGNVVPFPFPIRYPVSTNPLKIEVSFNKSTMCYRTVKEHIDGINSNRR